MLTLPEELLLLATHNEKGTLGPSASFTINYGLVGAILLELAIEGYIEFKEKRIIVRKRAYKENNIFNEALKHIKKLPKEKNARYWISKLNTKIKKLRERTTDQLVAKKILYKNEKKVLGIFSSKTYPSKNSMPKSEIRTRIREAVLNRKKPDERTAVLIALVQACGLINEIFSKDERKEAKVRIKDIIKKHHITKAVSDTITAIRALIVSGAVTTIMLLTG